MDDKKACEILGLDFNNLSNLVYKEIRSAYLKKSLRYHPDKNNGNDEEFKKVVEAYEILIKYLENNKKIRSDQVERNNGDYSYILEELLNEIIRNNENMKAPMWKKEFILTTIKSILKTFLNSSYKIFDNLDSSTCMEIYNFLIEFNDIGIIDDNYLSQLKVIFQKKINNVVVLEPSLRDLLNDKIYKLEMFNNTFYVPLWHNELVFDYRDSYDKLVNFIVKIEPDLENNYFIDENNNIFLNKKIKFCELEEIYKNGYLDVFVGDRKQRILSENIRMQKETQVFKFKNGMIKMNENDIFNTEKRGMIYIEINIL